MLFVSQTRVLFVPCLISATLSVEEVLTLPALAPWLSIQEVVGVESVAWMADVITIGDDVSDVSTVVHDMRFW